MAIGLPVKANYAAGDILTATNMNDLSGTFNNVATSYGNAAGKNKIINGDFSINQRNFTSVTTNIYCFDRFKNSQNPGSGTITLTPQTFTLGVAPVAGYEGKNFLQILTTGQSGSTDFSSFLQPIEDVRVFAGQTVTFSFWAKAASGTPNLSIELGQYFGTGGSPSAQVNTVGAKKAITTSWARYSFTVTLPSISGKTIGTNNDSSLSARIWCSAGSTLDARTDTLGNQNNTFQFWGIQLEAGSIATPFVTASGGSVQGELAMCQRYYYQTDSLTDNTFSPAIAATTGVLGAYFTYPVPMRIAPTITTYDTAGASGVVTRGTYGSGTIQNGQASTVFQTNRNGTNIYSGLGNSHTFIRFGYSASSEL